MTRSVALGEMTAEQRRIYQAGQALHRDGASPAGALDLLAAIIEDSTWERATDKDGHTFAGRFRAFVADRTHGLNTTPDELVKVIGLRHPRESNQEVGERIAAMRTEVERLLREEIPPSGPTVHAGPGRGKTNGATKGFDQGLTATTITARLKRDDPELAERVVNGEITANAAARAKGWRRPRIVVSTPERTATLLRQHMKPEDISTLARLLSEPV